MVRVREQANLVPRSLDDEAFGYDDKRSGYEIITTVIFGWKRDSLHFITGFSENVEVAEKRYQM